MSTELDCRGQRCPLPVIALAKAARTASPDTRITVISDDPASATDIPAWCRMRGQDFIGDAPLPDGAVAYTVRVG